MDDMLNLKQKIDEIYKPQSHRVWDRLADLLKTMSEEQVSFIKSNERVLAESQNLQSVFNDCLFEKFKDELSSIPAFKEASNVYIDTIIEASKGFKSEYQRLKEENERLRKELNKKCQKT